MITARRLHERRRADVAGEPPPPERLPQDIPRHVHELELENLRRERDKECASLKEALAAATAENASLKEALAAATAENASLKEALAAATAVAPVEPVNEERHGKRRG